MKKLFTILVGLLVTASVYSQTYEGNKFYPELGGYVILTDGTHGVVVAMQDQGDANWSDAKAMVNDASKHDSNGAKFNDWRLPTKDELNFIYKQRGSIGGFVLEAAYWSSTEIGYNNDAWEQVFYNGVQDVNTQNGSSYVRAVRDF